MKKKSAIFIGIIVATSASLFAQNSVNNVQLVSASDGKTMKFNSSVLPFVQREEVGPVRHKQTPKAQKKVSSALPLEDSVYYWNMDTATQKWVAPVGKYTNMAYDVNNNLTTQTQELWNVSSWAKDELYNYTYDANNNLLTTTYQHWSGSAWVYVTEFSYSYDINNNMLSDTNLGWSGSAWVNSELHLYTYDTHNNLLTETYQTWSGSAWINSTLNTYTYDANNNMLSNTSQTWSGSAWVNAYQHLYTYDVNNNNLTSVYQNWNVSAWVNFTQDVYTYNINNDRTTDTSYNWSGSAWSYETLNKDSYDAYHDLLLDTTKAWYHSSWVVSLLNTDTYNTNHYMLTDIALSWDGTSWHNFQSIAYTYDGYNDKLSYVLKGYSSPKTRAIYGDSDYYYYSALTAVNNFNNIDKNIKIYPNPGNGVFTIHSSVISYQYSVEIYNVLGEKVYSQSVIRNSQFVINLSQPNGIYFYRVLNNDGNVIGEGKLIIQK